MGSKSPPATPKRLRQQVLAADILCHDTSEASGRQGARGCSPSTHTHMVMDDVCCPSRRAHEDSCTRKQALPAGNRSDHLHSPCCSFFSSVSPVALSHVRELFAIAGLKENSFKTDSEQAMRDLKKF